MLSDTAQGAQEQEQALASKQEIVESLSQVEQRIERLAPRIREGLARPLPSGSWTVREALCHLAADTRGVPAFMARMERVAHGLPRREPGFDVDAYNEQQIAARAGRGADELLTEVREGLRADMQSLQDLDDGLLQRALPDFRGNATPVSDQMRAYLGGHPMRHLDDIEQALQD